MTHEMTYAFSRAYQMKLLALCFRRRDFLPAHRDIVSAEWFDDPIHADVAGVILRYYDEYGKAPTFEAVDEGMAQILLRDVRKARLAESYGAVMEEVAEAGLDDEEDVTARAAHFAKSQSLYRALTEASGLLDRGELDEIPRLIERAHQIGQNRIDLGTFHFRDNSRWHHQRSQTLIPTGIRGLDAVIGGVGITELGVIEAPPNKFKTGTLVNIGCGALRAGKSVIHITLENQQNSVGRRYDGCLLGADYAGLLYPEDGSVPELSDLTKAARELKHFHERTMANLVYKFYAPGTATETMIKAYVNTLINTGEIDPEQGFIIIVDYGMNMKAERQRESRRLEIQECYQGLLRLGDYFKCGVWSAMQTNRGSMKKKIIGMEDLAECFAVAADAHMIVSVNATDEEQDGYPAVDLFVARSRETRGQSIVRLGVDFDSTRYVGTGDVMSYGDYLRQYDGTDRPRRSRGGGGAADENATVDTALEQMRVRRAGRRNPSWNGNGSGNGETDGSGV